MRKSGSKADPRAAAGAPGGGWTLEQMREDDVPMVAAIEATSFGSPWPASAFLEEIHSPIAHCLVARRPSKQGGFEVGGYVCFWILGEELLINNLAVGQGHLRKGLGRSLLRRAIAEAHASSCRAAFLEVRPSNLPAIRLYETEGFEVVGKRRRYYSDTNEDALVMRAALKARETG